MLKSIRLRPSLATRLLSSTAILSIAAIFAVAAASGARAQTSNWIGGSGSLWDDSGSWTGGVPNSATAIAVFPNPPGNSFVQLNSGIFTLNSLRFSASTGSLYALSNGMLQFGGINPTIETDAGPQHRFATSLGPFSVTALSNLTFNTTAAGGGVMFESGAQLTGPGSITKNGAGTLTFYGVNSYTGGTVMNAGVLTLGGVGTLGATTGALTVNGGTLDLGGTSQTVGALAGTGGSITNASGAVESTLTVNQAADTTFSGTVSSGFGTVSLVKAGVGALTLTGANSYAGATSITAGTLRIGNGSALGSTAGGTTVASGAALELYGGIAVGAEALTLNGTGIANGGALRNVSGTNTYAGSITLASASRINTDADHLILSGTITGAGQNLTVGGAGRTSINGAITTGSGTLTADGGIVALSAANTYTGTTTVNSGSLQLINGSAIADAGAVVVNSAGTLQLAHTETIGSLAGDGVVILQAAGGGLVTGGDNTSTTFSGTISELGAVGSLTKIGTGIFTLSGANTYTGATSVTNGVLRISNGAALGGTGTGTTVTSGATLQLIGGISVGAEALSLIGNGAAGTSGVLQSAGGVNSHGGAITLTGTSRISVDAGSLTLSGGISGANTALTLGGAGTGTISGVIATGAGTVLKEDSGTWVLSSANTHTGQTSVTAGVLRITNGGALGGTVAGTTVSSGATLQVDGSISMAEAIGLAGSGIGGVSGALQSVSGTNTISGIVVLSADSRIAVDAGTLTLAGNLAGSGRNLSVVGPGTLILASDATLLTTDIVSGTLQVGGGGTTGSITGDIANASALVFNRSNNLTYSGVISGTGTLTKLGAGTVTLTGANTYTGATTISSGTLMVNGSLGSSAVTVGNNATLGGSGTIGGAVNVASGGTLSAGNSPGALTVGSLTLSAGSNTVFELNTPGVVGGATNDRIIVNGVGAAGNLTLGGTLTANVASAGYYRLFDVTGGGTISGSFDTLALSAPSVAGAVGTVYNAPSGVPNQVNLAVVGAGQTLQFWDGGDEIGNGTVNGGAGTWNAGNTNWTGAPGQAGINATWLSSVGVFQGTAGTVTVAGTQNFDTLQFNTDGYTLSGGVLALGVAAGGTINTAAGVTVSIGSTIDDGAGTSLTKVGAGTLALSGTNGYSGGTLLNAGALAIGSAGALGTGALQMSDGTTFRTLGNFLVSNAVSLSSGTATIDTGTFDSGLTGVISGAGTLSKTGTGTLTLSGVNTYSGATWIQEGTLRMGGAGVLPNQTAVQISAGAVFDLNGMTQTVGSLSGTGNVLFGGTTLTAGGNNSSTTFSGTMSGAGSLLKAGTGTLTLNGTNTNTGLTQVLAGRLVVDGSVATPVIVHAGATLAGSGSVGATTVGGTLSPGNSPGTLTVNGNLMMGVASTYIAEVQGAVADRVNVTGTASLAGTLRLVALGGTYSFSTPYTLLSAAGGLGGTTFGTVDPTGSFGDGVTTSIAYTGTDVQLTLTPKPLAPIVDPLVPGPTPSPRLGVGRPSNAYAVASAIDGAVANGADPSALFRIYNLPAASIPAAVNQLSGEVHTAAPAMANRAASQFLGTMLDGTGAGRLSGAPGGPTGSTSFTADLPSKQDGRGQGSFDPARFSLWGASFGSTGRNDGDRAVGSANRKLSDAHVAVGADIRLGSNTVVGAAVAGGQSRASLSGGLGKAEADVFQAGLYGRTTLGSLNLAGALGYARLETDTTRAIPALGLTGVAASYATQAWSGRIEASLPVASWGGITLSPLAAFQAVRASSPAAIERDVAGAGPGLLTLARRSDMTSRSEFGLELDASLMAGGTPVTTFVRAAWAHYYQRDADLTASLNGLPGASFAVTGARPDRNAVLLAAGADIRLSPTVSLGMRVDSELSGNTRRLGGTAQLRVNF